METSPAAPSIVGFGPFEVNVLTGELRKRGVRRSLQEQPRRILQALLEARGNIVTRQELCRRLWPDGTFVDYEHSLNAAIRRLRTTLGDGAAIPRFIETVPRRGYRFLGANDMPPAPRGRFRLAVIPFAVFASGETDAAAGAIFVDGLVDETITQLARLCQTRIGIIARTSVLSVAGTHHRAGDIGRALSADFLVEGSVRREGQRVRITAQLIEAADETHIWATTYDREMSGALTIQMEVAQAIAASVVEALDGDHRAAAGF
jgi:TolB-like protein/DNA-binding winged helix-turn-helix (wHTH) protein